MSNGLTLDEVAARYKRGDLIRWTPAARTKATQRATHKGEGKFQGTLDGRILVEYLVSARYGQWKMIRVDHKLVVLPDDGAVAA